MKDLAYAFTICFMILGPLKTIPVVILLFAGLAAGDMAHQIQLTGLLLAIMAANFVAMLCAGPIMRLVGVPVLQIVGWVFSALQAGLAVQAILNALRHLE